MEYPEMTQGGPEKEAAPVKGTALRPGEKGFTLVLFLLGLFFLVHSLSLWMGMEEPRIASAAALPLFCSGVWTVLTFIILLENIRKRTPLSGLRGLGARARGALGYAFPRVIWVMLVVIVAYCTMLLNVSFYIITPLFLYGSMCYLTRKGYLINILWTGICMAFIILVFRLLFGVRLP